MRWPLIWTKRGGCPDLGAAVMNYSNGYSAEEPFDFIEWITPAEITL